MEQAHETVEDGTVEDGINTLELRCVMVCVFFLTKDSCFYFQVKKSFADICFTQILVNMKMFSESFLEKWDRQLVRNISVIENMSIMSIHDI